MFAPAGGGRLRRRGYDGARLAVVVLALGPLPAGHPVRLAGRPGHPQVIHPPPWSIMWLVTVVYQAGDKG
jgi:hypothetical protein